MKSLRLDHLVLHIRDWSSTVQFYESVIGGEVIANEEGVANPLGATALRLGGQQINLHGPWPGRELGRCCPPPMNQPGTADLCFEWPGDAESAARHLVACGVPITEGPMQRFGARGWGTSIYTRDPDGNGIELISYSPPPQAS
jgi:catechol 2,3-dioxygenase-like lactoylglutathione lyase family enzyme